MGPKAVIATAKVAAWVKIFGLGVKTLDIHAAVDLEALELISTHCPDLLNLRLALTPASSTGGGFGLLSALGKMPQLEMLVCSMPWPDAQPCAQDTASGLAAACPHLKVLEMDWLRRSGPGDSPPALTPWAHLFPQLLELELSGLWWPDRTVDARHLAQIGAACPLLRKLELPCCILPPDAVDALAAFTALRCLDIYDASGPDHPFRGMRAPALRAVARACPLLEELRIGGWDCDMDEELMRTLCRALPRMHTLQMSTMFGVDARCIDALREVCSARLRTLILYAAASLEAADAVVQLAEESPRLSRIQWDGNDDPEDWAAGTGYQVGVDDAALQQDVDETLALLDEITMGRGRPAPLAGFSVLEEVLPKHLFPLAAHATRFAFEPSREVLAEWEAQTEAMREQAREGGRGSLACFEERLRIGGGY